MVDFNLVSIYRNVNSQSNMATTILEAGMTPEEKHNVILDRKYQKDGKRYEEYSAHSRTAAIAFLRNKEVKDEAHYISVATPEGWFGRDLLEIYNENTQERIELPQRYPLHKPIKSVTRCARCGYTVIPCDKTPDFGSGPGTVAMDVVVSEAKEKGAGYSCGSCNALYCAFCATPEESPLCSFCGEQMQPFNQ